MTRRRKINIFKGYKLLIPFFILGLTCSINAQIISQFTWEGPDVSVADIGPDFSVVSSSAESAVNGSEGTNGLNAGLPKQDLNFRLLDNPIFDVKGIDISFDYQRDESSGNFLKRGSSLNIGGGSTSTLSVSYRVEDGAGGFTTVTSGNVFSIPNDDIFRTYRFVYLPSNGVGTLSVDGVVQWTNDGPDNRSMYWTGAGNIEFGNQMDGSGANKPFFDNLIIGSVTDSPLPIKLIYFEVSKTENNQIKLDWETASEINNDFFTIEKSNDIENWKEVLRIEGAGNSSTAIIYSSIDNQPYSGVTYYRLKQTDYDGNYSYSSIKAIEVFSILDNKINVFPNPANSSITIQGNELSSLRMFDSFGKAINLQTSIINTSSKEANINLSNLKPGIYFIKSNSQSVKLIKK